jgi:ATP-dependent Clp protease, protease subunit
MGIFGNRSQDDDPSDVYTRQLRERIVFLNAEIDDRVANTIVAQLLYLASEDSAKDIQLYINSPGGSVTAGMAIYDTIRHINANTRTTCMGLAGGIAGLLLASGTPGKRFSLPHARIMLCPLYAGIMDGVDLETQSREMRSIQSQINDLLAAHTGQPVTTIQADTQQEFWLSPAEAVNYGLIDRIVERAALPHLW